MWLNAKRLYFALIGLVVIALIAVGICSYLSLGFLKDKSKNVQDARLALAVLEEKQNSLIKAKADVQRYQDLSNIAKSIVPQDKDQVQTVREISNLADANGVILGSITFPSSGLGIKTASPAAKGTTSAPDAQLKPVEGLTGIYSLEITVRSDSGVSVYYDSLISFLRSLEQNRRTALVSGVTLTPDAKAPGKVQFSLTIREYIKP